MLANSNMAQAYIKRFLAMLWYKKIKQKKDGLVNHIQNIDQMIKKYDVEVNAYKAGFSD